MFKRFHHWFINVLWYHYKAHMFVGLLILIGTVSLLRTCTNNPAPDFIVVIGTSERAHIRNSPQLNRFLSEALELHTGEPMLVRSYVLGLSRADRNYYDNHIRLNNLFANRDVALFILDETILNNFRQGFELYPQIDVSETYIIRSIRIHDMTQSYYAVIRLEQWRNPEAYELALVAIEAILNS